jgi:hypothetical protein
MHDFRCKRDSDVCPRKPNWLDEIARKKYGFTKRLENNPVIGIWNDFRNTFLGDD